MKAILEDFSTDIKLDIAFNMYGGSIETLDFFSKQSPAFIANVGPML